MSYAGLCAQGPAEEASQPLSTMALPHAVKREALEDNAQGQPKQRRLEPRAAEQSSLLSVLELNAETHWSNGAVPSPDTPTC